jgi:hypothetical protein
MKPIIKFALGIAGMPEATVLDIEKALPAMARLIALATKLEPELKIIQPDVAAVLPVLGEIINFVKGE